MLGQRTRSRRGFQRRAAALELGAHLRIGDQLVLDALVDGLFQLVGIRGAQQTHIRLGAGDCRDHVTVGTGLRHRPVNLEPGLGLGQIAHLQHLVRQFIQRVAALLRCTACVRGLALHIQQDGADAAGGQRQLVGRHTRALAREHGILLGAQLGLHGARARRADLFIAVDEHSERAVLLEANRLQDRDGVQDDGHAVLVVGDTQAISAVAVDTERLLREHALEVHRIHVRDQHDVARAFALEARKHHLADLLGCVGHAVGVIARVDQLDVAAQQAQAVGNHAGNLVQAFDVLAARLNRHQRLHGVDQRRLFLLGALVDLGRRHGGGLTRSQCTGHRQRCQYDWPHSPHHRLGSHGCFLTCVVMVCNKIRPRFSHARLMVAWSPLPSSDRASDPTQWNIGSAA